MTAFCKWELNGTLLYLNTVTVNEDIEWHTVINEDTEWHSFINGSLVTHRFE